MSSISSPNQSPRQSRRSGAFAILLLVLTSIHHAYGALVYQTPWRLHVVAVAIPIAAAILFMSRSDKRGWQISAAVLILIFPVLLIGLFEGGYNHLAKNIVFFTAGASKTRSLFPPPAYELPGDLFFELTGMAQFVIAPFAALETFRLLRGERRESTN